VITAEEIANYDDYLIVSKKGISWLIKETCRDANGQNLTDEFVEEILDKAKTTKET
jgi:hypothetical protein